MNYRTPGIKIYLDTGAKIVSGGGGGWGIQSTPLSRGAKILGNAMNNNFHNVDGHLYLLPGSMFMREENFGKRVMSFKSADGEETVFVIGEPMTIKRAPGMLTKELGF